DLIHRMGDKVEARKLVRAAGGPVVPGKDLGPDATVQEAAKAAEEIGFPIMIKARGGGGGKGMKVVHAPGDFADAFNLARTEAERAFGNAAVYLEKRLERARHVEIQVLGDKHGGVIHLGERDCSIQRRFQKVIEEARAPAMPQKVMDEMAASAAALARNIGYDSAGTLEFLVDRDHHFYFLEMNTRIQVEHPVTEMITGVDLVKGQVLVAAGEKLPITQEDVRFTGHAVECRVLAEDFETGRPSTGRVRGLHSPGGLGVRVESAVVSGTEISPYYDPMIMKIIAHGEDRDHAIARMKVALQETSILGFKTNLPWLLKAIDHPEFRAGRADTTFFERCKL
ncbi:MAG: ATP-grasp domain-containing protein, partial [Candidatus Methylomirabilis sp.]|nr:ATP-grasp domain-containing protein [Deltaproteobacteria bacterium]